MNLLETLDNTSSFLSEFEERIRDVDPVIKGVLFSEILFLQASLGGRAPSQILESGRAQGQSTKLLSLCFPDSQVISVEHNSSSPDATIALERLAALPNVAPLFGDSRIVLPALVQQNSIALIDGPKGLRALPLAVRLLATGKVRAVYLHDFYQGLPERRYIERHIPGVFFSDNPDFVRQSKHLDGPCWTRNSKAGEASGRPYHFAGQDQESYGPTMACIPHLPDVNYRRLLNRIHLARVVSKLQDRFLRAA